MIRQEELPWVAEARKYVGLQEIPGKQNNSTITNWLIGLRAWWRDDETPWCGTFVGHCIQEAKRLVPSAWYRAKSWADAGTTLTSPAYGCIAVFDRAGGGHVGFVVGKDKLGNLMILGGNQSNGVNIKPFSRTRVIAYVWPSRENGERSWPVMERYSLPTLQSDGHLSTDEA